jgi:hypothetical protein
LKKSKGKMKNTYALDKYDTKKPLMEQLSYRGAVEMARDVIQLLDEAETRRAELEAMTVEMQGREFASRYDELMRYSPGLFWAIIKGMHQRSEVERMLSIVLRSKRFGISHENATCEVSWDQSERHFSQDDWSKVDDLKRQSKNDDILKIGLRGENRTRLFANDTRTPRQILAEYLGEDYFPPVSAPATVQDTTTPPPEENVTSTTTDIFHVVQHHFAPRFEIVCGVKTRPPQKRRAPGIAILT